jgi:carbamoyltransferase
LSHAVYAFQASKFDSSIIVVSDAGGNIIGPSSELWWESPREQTTYFLATKKEIRIIGRDFQEPLQAGFGEVFRAVTHYLGWTSSVHASKTMALSALGEAQALGLTPPFVYDRASRTIRPGVHNNPPEPIKMISEFCNGRLLQCVRARAMSGEFRPEHAHLAAWLQDSYERSLSSRLEDLIKNTGITNACMSGGVAYNCQANSRILVNTHLKSIFIPPAPGDTGQAIGNAIWAHGKTSSAPLDRDSIGNPFLGKAPSLNLRALLNNLSGVELLQCDDQLESLVARSLHEGLVLGIARGRSEFGARALGNRSILADPRIKGNSDKLNRRKGREPFMPFAATCLSSKIGSYFQESIESPYMQLVSHLRPELSMKLEAIKHADGSTRLHSISDTQEGSWLARVLKEFEHLSGVALLLNTSFNGPGQPIVESLQDAVDTLNEGLVDAIVFQNSIVGSAEAVNKIKCFDQMAISNS